MFKTWHHNLKIYQRQSAHQCKKVIKKLDKMEETNRCDQIEKAETEFLEQCSSFDEITYSTYEPISIWFDKYVSLFKILYCWKLTFRTKNEKKHSNQRQRLPRRALLLKLPLHPHPRPQKNKNSILDAKSVVFYFFSWR